MKQSEPERIAIPDLQARLQSERKLTIVDVRELQEIRESGAVPNAVHAPIGQIGERMDDFPATGDLVFYCGGGGRASRAAQEVWNRGRRNVFYFGLRDWKRRNLPTAKAAKPL